MPIHILHHRKLKGQHIYLKTNFKIREARFTYYFDNLTCPLHQINFFISLVWRKTQQLFYIRLGWLAADIIFSSSYVAIAHRETKRGF